jgi:hypothetical protein
MIQYTYDTIKTNFACNEYILDNDTMTIITNLEKELGVIADIPDAPSMKRSDRSFERRNGKNRRGYKMSRASSMNDMNIDDWESIRNFKATEKVVLSNFDQKISCVRSNLNKLSKEKYNDIKDIVIENITDIMTTEHDNQENQKKMGDTVFDICSNNRFLSDLYAELYVELVGQHDIFGDILDNFICVFKTSLNNIVYVDPDVNYDGFCEYNQLNEQRKSHSVFLVNLMKHDMITKQSIMDLIITLQESSLVYIDQENKTHEVCEITENLFLFVTVSKDFLKDEPMWNEKIMANVSHFSSLKAKDHISLSSRCVFKYMDMK